METYSGFYIDCRLRLEGASSELRGLGREAHANRTP